MKPSYELGQFYDHFADVFAGKQTDEGIHRMINSFNYDLLVLLLADAELAVHLHSKSLCRDNQSPMVRPFNVSRFVVRRG
jgi:hypothetical protein